MAGEPLQDEIRVELLGPIQLRQGDRRVQAGTPGQQAVLAILAMRTGTLVGAGDIIDGLYEDDPPASAQGVVVNYVHRLRKQLPGNVIQSAPGGYILKLPRDAVDALRFSDLTRRAREPGLGVEAAAGLLREARGLWRGPALAGLTGPHAESQRNALTEQHATALEHHLELLLELGQHVAAIPDIRGALNMHPYREHLHGALMLALYRSGRTAEALTAYDDARTVLAEELGIDPGPALRERHAAILHGAPELLAVPVPEPNASPQPDLASAPSQLPPALADFTGRAEESAELTEVLTGDQAEQGGIATTPIVVVTGMPGVGKTSLAVRVAHTVAARYPGGQLYADLRGHGDGEPAKVTDVLHRFLHALGVGADHIPTGRYDRAALYRTTLAARGRVLVVLDNAADAAHVEQLLPGSADCAAIITSRRALTAALPATKAITLPGLTPGEAVTLIGRITGDDKIAASPASAADVAAACGYLPLALRIAASRLTARQHWTITDLATRLSDERRRIGELKAGSLGVEAAFEVSYRQLPPRLREAFLLLAVPDAADLTISAATAILGALGNPGPRPLPGRVPGPRRPPRPLEPEPIPADPQHESEDILEALADSGFLETHTSGRYRFHDLVKVFARSRPDTELPPNARGWAQLRLADFALATAKNACDAAFGGDSVAPALAPTLQRGRVFSDSASACAWATRELPNVLDTIAQSFASVEFFRPARRTPRLATDLMCALAMFARSVPWKRLEGAVRLALGAATGTAAEPVARYALGALLCESSVKFAEAEEELHHARRLLTDPAPGELGPVTLPLLGECARDAREQAHRSQVLLAFVLDRLGEVNFYVGKLDEAQRIWTQSDQLAVDAGYTAAAYRHRGGLALIALRQGDAGKAEQMALQLLADQRESGDVDGQIEALFLTSRVHLLRDHPLRAANTLHQALGLTVKAGLHRSQGVGTYWLAEAVLRSGDAHQAARLASEALELSHRDGHEMGVARSHAILGRAQQALGDKAEGDRNTTIAGEVYTRLGMPDDPAAPLR